MEIKFWVSLIFRIVVVGAGILAAVRGVWIDLTLSIFVLLLSFLPDIIAKKYKSEYPSVFGIIAVIFIYASIYLGEFQRFYEMFWWWDVFLHTFSGIIIGIIGFLWVHILNKEKKFSLSPLFVCVFAFSFAMMLAGIWEIYEFAMDQLFGFNMQKSGLVDTMWDLIVTAAGAFVISLIGYFYLKKIKFFKK